MKDNLPQFKYGCAKCNRSRMFVWTGKFSRNGGETIMLFACQICKHEVGLQVELEDIN